MNAQTCKTLANATLVLNKSKFNHGREHVDTIMLTCTGISFFFHSEEAYNTQKH